jgi:hypothetical protein
MPTPTFPPAPDSVRPYYATALSAAAMSKRDGPLGAVFAERARMVEATYAG